MKQFVRFISVEKSVPISGLSYHLIEQVQSTQLIPTLISFTFVSEVMQNIFTCMM